MSTTLPATVGGRRIPSRFRNPLLRLDSPVVAMREFVAWLEEDAAVTARELRDTHELDRLTSDRRVLVDALVELGDVLDSPALRQQVSRALDKAGVTAVDATGEPFDAARHRAVDRVPTRDGGEHHRVAETERVGYSDRGRIIRPPEVLVYWHEPSGNGR